MRRIFWPALLPLLMAATAARGASGAQDAAREAIRRFDLQAEMPTKAPEPASWSDLFKFDISQDTVRLLLWGAVILGILIVAWSLRDSIPVFSRSRKIVAREDAVPGSGLSSRLGEAQVEADDLARQGRYGEAMRLLLAKCLVEIRAHLGLSFAASLTSREILQRVRLPDDGRGALGAIVASVERTHYGGRPARPDDYAGCRDAFETLRRSLTAMAGT